MDQQGGHLNEAQVTWAVLDPNAGLISPSGLFTAGEVAGTFEGAVEAQAENGITALVSASIVSGPLQQITVAPDSVQLGYSETQQFVAVAADKFGNRISGLGFTWAVEGGGGTIHKRTGFFTSGEDVGQFTNTVKAWRLEEGEVISGNGSVTVEPDRIAFISDRDGEPNLYIMNSDGTDARQLTTSGIDLGRLSWSPDGRRIAYGADGGIKVIGDDGNWNITILSEGSSASEPSWSPDGTKIAYQQWEGDSADSAEIYVMDIDGGNVTALTDNSDYDDYPSWSPDGSQLVFSRTSTRIAGAGGELFIVSADGSNERKILNLGSGVTTNNIGPNWSVDGRIAYQSFDLAAVSTTFWVIQVVGADGSGHRGLLVLQRQFAKWALRTSSWRPAHALDSFVDLPSAKRFPANN